MSCSNKLPEKYSCCDDLGINPEARFYVNEKEKEIYDENFNLVGNYVLKDGVYCIIKKPNEVK